MRTIFATAIAILISMPAMAANHDIATRQALMEGNGVSAAVSAGMLKGDIAYNPRLAKAAIDQLYATAHTFGFHFPEGSDKGKTTAAPAIWTDADGFAKALDKFKADTAVALKAAGKKGPADLAAFKKVITPVLHNCKSCHQDYRVKH